VRSAPTSHLLTDFIVREIFCKSVLMNISKKEVLEGVPREPALPAIDSKVIEGAK